MLRNLVDHFVNELASQRGASVDEIDEKERAQLTLNSMGDAVISADVSGHVRYLNPTAESLTGWSHSDAAGRSVAEVLLIVDGATHSPIQNPLRTAMEQNHTVNLPANCVLIRRDGAEVPIEDSAAPIHDRHGRVTGAVLVLRDVTAARAMARRMTHLAQHDALTGLPNRLLFNDRLTQAIAMARRHNHQLAVLFVDLDCFKHTNDSLGHMVGDQLLKSVAHRLLSCVRSTDTVCRMGGDEFVVLLSEISHPSDAVIHADKIIKALCLPHTIDEHRLHLTASIGAAIFPHDGHDTDTLVRHADSAMFKAKKNGRNHYYLFAPIRSSASSRIKPRDHDLPNTFQAEVEAKRPDA